MTLRSLVLTLFTFASSFAHAGFHFEPYLGFSLDGQWKLDDAKEDVSATEFGLKMGYQASGGFQVGGDIQLAGSKYSNIFGVSDEDAAQAAFGLYLGYQTDMGLRMYAHYLFASALVFDDTDDTTFAGNGFKFGVGYSIVSWFAINLEYHMMKYDEFKSNTVTDYQDLSPEFKNNMMFINFSFPFNFGGSSSYSDDRSYRRSR